MNRNSPHAGLLQRAQAAHQAGQLAEARLLYRDILAVEPANAEVLYALAILAQQLGRPDVAARRLQEALTHRPDFIEARVALGNSYLALGQLDQAAGPFEQAVALAPDLAEAHNGLGLLRQRQGRLEDAVTHYRRAIALRPNYAAAHNNLGTTCRELGRFDQAIGHYETALGLEPNPQIQANLAAILERANRPEAARQAAEKALALDPSDAKSRLVLAKVKVRAGDREGARRDYEALIAALAEPRGPGQILSAARAHAELARLSEDAGQFQRAMELYRQANRLNCRSVPDWQGDAADYLAWVRGHGRLLDALEGADRRPPVPQDQATPPIFLVGFPRSGTTLLDQALAALPGVVLMEEKTALDEVRAQLGGPEESAAVRLMALGEAERLELRRSYRRIAERHLGTAIEGRRLIDKMPLNLLNLWLIHGLFPDARIVVSLRDPRDVCLSCFTTLFRLRPGTANFPTLEQAALLYREIMGLWLRQEELMALNARSLRYEDLVGDFEGELRGLLSFLDLPWHDAILNYAEAARQRPIVTPSYDQVVKPLYSSSIDRWRNYADELAPVLPELAPFVEAFGYE